MAINCNDDTFLEARLARVEQSILAWEEALDAVSAGQTYKLDTGQTVVSLTRANLTEINKTIESLMNRRAMLRQELGCSGTLILRPGW